MQEKPPFSSYIDFFSNVREGDTPSHTHPLRTLNLSSGTPLNMITLKFVNLLSNPQVEGVIIRECVLA